MKTTSNTQLRSLLVAKRELKRGLLQQVTSGISRFPEFRSSGPWVDVALADVLDVVSRPVAWSDSDTYRLVSIRRRNGGLFLRRELQGSAIKTKKLFTIHDGDFVLSRMQVVHGAMSVVASPFDQCHVSGMYMVLRPNKSAMVTTQFLHYLAYLPAMYRKVLVSCHGVHIEKMTFDPRKFLKKSIQIPPTIDEQDKITRMFTTLDREIELLGLEVEEPVTSGPESDTDAADEMEVDSDDLETSQA